MSRYVAIALCVLVACKGNNERPKATPSPSPAVSAPRAKPEGPSIAPVITNSVTFVVPKAASWWGEFQYACYRAVMSLTSKGDPGAAFEKISPTVPEAMRAGEIDLGRDVTGMGMFDCAGSPCIYIAGHLEHPEKMPDVLGKLIPGVAAKTVAPGHYTLDTPSTVNPSGTRTIHVRVVPIDWTGAQVPDDPWSQEADRATHVVFIGGVDGKNADVDPVTLLADAATGAAHVKEAESVLADTHDRCMLALVGEREFQPGYQLARARFALAAPMAAKTDAMMAMLDSKKTIDAEVELVLSPAPTKAKADQWVEMGKMFLSGIGANIRGQFDQTAATDVTFEMMSLVGEKAFVYSVKDSSLHLSWRTDRIPRADLNALESRIQSMLGP